MLGNETLKSAQGIFMCYDGTNFTGVVLGGATSATQRQIVPSYDSTSYLASNRYLEWTYETYAYFMTPSRFGFGSTNFTYTKGSTHTTGILKLGTASGGQRYTGEMGVIRIYGSNASGATSYSALEGYTPVYTLYPYVLNGEAGFYCAETRTFYGKSEGSGTLIAE